MTPGTATGIFQQVRELFAMSPDAVAAGYGTARFSSNLRGGRCEKCTGLGRIKVSMVFMPDVEMECTECLGSRFNPSTLRVKYRGLSIADVYDLSVEDALGFFRHVAGIRVILETLHDVGLGYLRLGQSATTLSGGEAQRIKLARELSSRRGGETLFLLDELSNGLHPRDIDVLLSVLGRLVEEGHTIVCVDHHVRVLAASDWVVELGREGGIQGGYVVYAGVPSGGWGEQSETGRYVRGQVREE